MLALTISSCTTIETTLRDVRKSATECELLNSRIDLLEERDREIIRRLDSIDSQIYHKFSDADNPVGGT